VFPPFCWATFRYPNPHHQIESDSPPFAHKKYSPEAEAPGLYQALSFYACSVGASVLVRTILTTHNNHRASTSFQTIRAVAAPVVS